MEPELRYSWDFGSEKMVYVWLTTSSACRCPWSKSRVNKTFNQLSVRQGVLGVLQRNIYEDISIWREPDL